MSENWYYVLKGQRLGPVDLGVMSNLILAGQSESLQSPHGQIPALSYTWSDPAVVLNEILPSLMKLGVWDFIIDPWLMGIDEGVLKQKMLGLNSDNARL